MTPQDRLRFHQEHSGPVMDGLRAWLGEQMEARRVEPNSGLGKAITYMLKHWTELTLFLREPGAPLDNNVCERALKRAILHRRNSLFYKSEEGARVGDAYMSLIHTAELNEVNPFDYLVALQRNNCPRRGESGGVDALDVPGHPANSGTPVAPLKLGALVPGESLSLIQGPPKCGQPMPMCTPARLPKGHW